MQIQVRVEPLLSPLPEVEYGWDADTDILTANVRFRGTEEGVSGSVEMEGRDGSWVIFDVQAGHIAGLEVAVWPEVRKVELLQPPANATIGCVAVDAAGVTSGVTALEVDTHLAADADAEEQTIHFRFGASHQVRGVRIAQDLVLEIDERDRIAGVWLLNVPPFPGDK